MELLEVVLPGLLRVVDMLAERTLEIYDHVLGLDVAGDIGLLARSLAAHCAYPALGLAELPQEAIRYEVIISILLRVYDICKKRGNSGEYTDADLT